MRSEKIKSPDICAVVLCAGKGERCGLPYNKILHRIGHKTVLETTLDAFARTRVGHITVVASEADCGQIKQIVEYYKDAEVVIGGDTRADSVLCGLRAHKCDIVVIHDGARPFVTPEIIDNAVQSAIDFGSGIAAVKSVDTVKRVDREGKVHALPRNEIYCAQTPQAFRYGEILEAYEKFSGAPTDDAEVYEQAGFAPRLIEGEYDNTKITTEHDLLRLPINCRVGVGFDIHRLIEGRPLVLGGVKIEHDKGLLGHSDADVLLHAIMDALLSAAGLPDIGVLFPDTDPKYEGISSTVLLDEVGELIRDAEYKIINVSAVVIAQQPKLAPVIPTIRICISKLLDISPMRVNVSATTTERLGLIGEGGAIAVNASCLLAEDKHDL